jgi:Icc protein
MHHPPISVASAWLDRIMLQNADELAAVLESAPQVRGIFCGHVHQEFDGKLGAIPVFTTPATGIQFAPRTDALQFDKLPPGFRVIDLDGDEFHTRVVRLPEVKHLATPNV